MAPFCFPLRRRDRFGRPALPASCAPETDGFSPLSGSFTLLPMAPRKAQIAASRRSLDLRCPDITSARPFRQILFAADRRRPTLRNGRCNFSRKNHLHLAAFCL
jgi:hypothetical protein